MDAFGLDTAAASASSLAAVGTTQATGTQPLGPCLHVRMGEDELVTRVNALHLLHIRLSRPSADCQHR